MVLLKLLGMTTDMLLKRMQILGIPEFINVVLTLLVVLTCIISLLQLHHFLKVPYSVSAIRIEQSLPNVTGNVIVYSPWTNASGSGALWTSTSYKSFVAGTYNQTTTDKIFLSLQKGNGVYQDGASVRPNSLGVLFYICY